MSATLLAHSGSYKTQNGTERHGPGSNLTLIFHAAAPAKMRASELIYMEGNFVTWDSTKQRENASERAEQAVMIQYNTAWVPMIPQLKQFCYHVDTRHTQQWRCWQSRHSPVGLELTEGFSLLGGVHSHNTTFRRRLPRPVASFPYSQSTTSGEKFLSLHNYVNATKKQILVSYSHFKGVDKLYQGQRAFKLPQSLWVNIVQWLLVSWTMQKVINQC